MRVGSKCIPAEQAQGRAGVDSTPAEFAATMGYGNRRYDSPAEFLTFHSGSWIRELHQVLAELLDVRRSVLSIGSGECEHEVPFVLEGYDIVASDVVDSGELTRRLFPGLRFQAFDVLRPHAIGTFDDVLITGLDFYFADEDFSRLMANVRTLLRPGGRLLFTLRYRDNFATWGIDRVGIPAICAVLRFGSAVGLSGRRWVMKRHGYRRSPREVIQRAADHGFRLGRVLHAGFGGELTRVYLDRFAPPLYALAQAVDRRLCVFNNAIVFEFLT
jgi:SAM-dependent methyltransferase